MVSAVLFGTAQPAWTSTPQTADICGSSISTRQLMVYLLSEIQWLNKLVSKNSCQSCRFQTCWCGATPDVWPTGVMHACVAVANTGQWSVVFLSQMCKSQYTERTGTGFKLESGIVSKLLVFSQLFREQCDSVFLSLKLGASELKAEDVGSGWKQSDDRMWEKGRN